MARIKKLSFTIFGSKLNFPSYVRTVAWYIPGGVYVKISSRRKDHTDEYKSLLREQEHCNKGSLVKRRPNRHRRKCYYGEVYY